MVSKPKNIDEYIDAAQPFAQPILLRIRSLVQKNCPSVEEALKWGMPHFIYKGKNICSMASFKAHCSFNCWYAAGLGEGFELFTQNGKDGMGLLGKITSLKELPNAALMGKLIKEVMKMIDNGVTLASISAANKLTAKTKEIVVHDSFLKALQKDKAAKVAFETFSPSHQWEYTSWINEAKTEATRDKRIAQAIEWLRERKSRNWKYQTKK